MIQQSYGREPRVKYLCHPNQGVSAARNVALKQAQGNYIALLDSDDIWKPWKLDVQMRCLQALPEAGMIWTDMEAIDSEGKIVQPRYLHVMYHAYRWFTIEQLFSSRRPLRDIVSETPAECAEGTVFVGDIFSPMIMGNLVHTSTVLLTRERFSRVREFNVNLHLSGEDYDFHLRTSRAGPVAFVNVSSIQYQLGFEDRLTRHVCEIAKNFVKTLDKTLAHEKDNIRLPAWMVRRMLADSNSWAGDESLSSGDKMGARGYFRRSLHYRKWQPRMFFQWLRCHLPGPLERTMLSLYHLGKEE